MGKIFCIVYLALMMGSCHGQSAKNIETIPPSAYAEKIKSNPDAQILDVRTPEEFAGERLPNAVNVDWNSDDFEAKAAKLDKSKPVFVYCKIGGRSNKAANKLNEMGFSQVYNLEGGILKWNADGFGSKTDKVIGMDANAYTKLLEGEKPVLVNFNAKWCEPCRKMAPYLEKMQAEMTDRITVIRLDADENKTLVSQMNIDSLPVLLLYKNKKVVWQHKGYISEAELKKQLQ